MISKSKKMRVSLSNANAVEDRPASPETNQNIIIKENNTDNTSYSIPDKC